MAAVAATVVFNEKSRRLDDAPDASSQLVSDRIYEAVDGSDLLALPPTQEQSRPSTGTKGIGVPQRHSFAGFEKADLVRLETTSLPQTTPGSDDGPVSVIHAPVSFRKIHRGETPTIAATKHNLSPSMDSTTSSACRLTSDISIPYSPSEDDTGHDVTEGSCASSSNNRRHVRSSSDAVQILNVGGDLTAVSFASPRRHDDEDLGQLYAVLNECWNLCSRLAQLSTDYRRRLFSLSSKALLLDTAWTACRSLCQDLYGLNSGFHSNFDRSIELCREFARARFELRSEGDPTIDAMLRVSFEMNIHLYNTRDRNLPATVVKRTMDFYIAFCHRMMRQPSVLSPEIDALLNTCWALAESLYRLHQSSNEESLATEELLESTIDACWELSDILRAEWAQSKRDRSTVQSARQTPRASQLYRPNARSSRQTPESSHRTYAVNQSPSGSTQPNSSPYTDQLPLTGAPPVPPETPVTVFDDVSIASSPGAHVGSAPNILVLGPGSTHRTSESEVGETSLGSMVDGEDEQGEGYFCYTYGRRHGYSETE